MDGLKYDSVRRDIRRISDIRRILEGILEGYQLEGILRERLP